MESEEKYKNLKKEYRELRHEYHLKKDELFDNYRSDLYSLKDEYYLKRKTIKDPLKEEKYKIRLAKKQKHRKMNEAPKRGVLEEIGNSVSHGVGAILGIVFLVLMLLKADTPMKIVAVTIYGICLIAQMLFSCLYHAFKGGTEVKRIFRRFDYCSIYLCIGGTLTPFYLIYMPQYMWGDLAGLIFFISQWVIIATGITFVAVFGPGRLKGLHFSLYFVVGWVALLFVPTWIKNNINIFFLILSGGLTYTLGMIPFVISKKKGVSHFIFHLLVIIATILMWSGIYIYVI